MKHRKTEGSDTVRSCSLKTFIGTLSNTPLSLSRTIVIEAIADGSVPLETSCLSSTRTRSASCSILDLLDPLCTLSPFSIILLPNIFNIFDRPCFSRPYFSLVFSFSSFFFSSFNYDFFFLSILFFPFALSPVAPQVGRRIRTESWPENRGFGVCVRVLLATLLSAATPKLLYPAILRRRKTSVVARRYFHRVPRIEILFKSCLS